MTQLSFCGYSLDLYMIHLVILSFKGLCTVSGVSINTIFPSLVILLSSTNIGRYCVLLFPYQLFWGCVFDGEGWMMPFYRHAPPRSSIPIRYQRYDTHGANRQCFIDSHLSITCNISCLVSSQLLPSPPIKGLLLHNHYLPL